MVVVLVTGGSGLVGSAVNEFIAERLPHTDERWVFASSKDADLLSHQATSALFDKVKPTDVLHFAAKVGGLYANAKDGVGFWRQNMAMQVFCSSDKISAQNAFKCLFAVSKERCKIGFCCRTTSAQCAKRSRCKNLCPASALAYFRMTARFRSPRTCCTPVHLTVPMKVMHTPRGWLTCRTVFTMHSMDASSRR